MTEGRGCRALYGAGRRTRGRAVARFNENIESIQWDEIVFVDETGSLRVSLPEPLANDPVLHELNAAVAEAKDFGDFAARIRAS